jgi:hypothetical protein
VEERLYTLRERAVAPRMVRASKILFIGSKNNYYRAEREIKICMEIDWRKIHGHFGLGLGF